MLAFLTNGDKFAQCANYTDITADVKCKVISWQRKEPRDEKADFQVMEGVENVELASECSSSVITTTMTTTTSEGESSPFLLFV